MTTPLEILKSYWNFNSFNAPQEEIINAVLHKKDTLALLPTGGGKSICFQIPALIQPGVCIVISPLIALMQDQVKNLQKRDIKAVALTSRLSQDEMITVFDNLQFGNYKFLYLSPERLQSNFIQEKIKQLNVNFIAIDEAHCISEWGHDFRPSYLSINILRQLQPQANFIALTATATPKVIDDITENLQLKDPQLFKKSFFRKNLAYQVFEVEDKHFKILQIINKIKAPAIIYTGTRKQTIEISNFLNSHLHRSCYYHGGLSNVEKQEAFENWLSEKTPIIVATNAFGMGIDKANVRAVIHINLPSSIENYIQEAGRAGRDGKKAFSVVLKNKNDLLLFEKQHIKELPSLDFIKEVYFKLNQYFRISYGEHIEKPFPFNFREFCNLYQFPTLKTYQTLKTLVKEGILEFDENFQKKSTLKFIVTSQEIFNYLDRNPSLENFIKVLLRSYGGVFEHFTSINEYFIAKKLSLSKKAVIKILDQLHNDCILSYNYAVTDSQISFLTPREDNRTINRISHNIDNRHQHKIEKATELLQFIENNSVCRSQQLLQYFGEKQTEKCGICEVCISEKKDQNSLSLEQISTAILTLFENDTELSSREITALINKSEKEVLQALQLLLEKNKLIINKQNSYCLKKHTRS